LINTDKKRLPAKGRLPPSNRRACGGCNENYGAFAKGRHDDEGLRHFVRNDEIVVFFLFTEKEKNEQSNNQITETKHRCDPELYSG